MQSLGEDVGDLINGVNIFHLKHSSSNLLSDEVNINFDVFGSLVENRIASK